MRKKTKNTINFTLFILVSLLIGLVLAIADHGGIKMLSYSFIDPYTNGHFFGEIISLALGSFIIAFSINFIDNLFRKNQKPFSYTVLWIFFIILSIAAFSKHEHYYNTNPFIRHAMKQRFVEGCLHGAQSSINNLESSEQEKAKEEIKQYCQTIYEKIDECLKSHNDKAFCNKQAVYNFCKDVADDKAKCDKLKP